MAYSIINMSDLAPFVAATIRDKVVLEQQEEIEALRAERDEARNKLAKELVTVTSPDGTHIYAQGSLATRTVTSDGDGGTCNAVEFIDNTSNLTFAKCQVREIENAVIQIRGQILCRIGDYSNMDCISGEEDEDTSILYMFDNLDPQNEALRHLGPKMNVVVDYGPVPEEYQTANIGQSPNNHENEDIEHVKFLDIEFSGARLRLFE